MCFPASCIVKEIPFGGDEYRKVLESRDRILRRPLGLDLSPGDTAGEDGQRHFVIGSSEGDLLGGVIAIIEHPVRLRQMWVETDRAGQGFGRHLLESVLRILAAEGHREVVLHARQPVLGFYRKCGFDAEGEEFTEVGIPHLRMRKALSPETRSPGCHR